MWLLLLGKQKLKLHVWNEQKKIDVSTLHAEAKTDFNH